MDLICHGQRNTRLLQHQLLTAQRQGGGLLHVDLLTVYLHSSGALHFHLASLHAVGATLIDVYRLGLDAAYSPTFEMNDLGRDFLGVSHRHFCSHSGILPDKKAGRRGGPPQVIQRPFYFRRAEASTCCVFFDRVSDGVLNLPVMSFPTRRPSKPVEAALFAGRQFLAAALLGSAALQVPGFAELTSPQPGQVVSGLVTLSGTADHPAFNRYELSFAYVEDTTDTWFSIGEPVDTRVIDGRLALWDTSAITDGDYSLRLRVWLQDGRSLEAVVPGIRVRNYSSDPVIPTAVPPETGRPLPIPTLPGAQPGIESPPQPPPAEPAAPSPFWMGAAVSLTLLAGVAAYALAAPPARAYLSYLRTRQLHRRLDRSRARGRRR